MHIYRPAGYVCVVFSVLKVVYRSESRERLGAAFALPCFFLKFPKD